MSHHIADVTGEDSAALIQQTKEQAGASVQIAETQQRQVIAQQQEVQAAEASQKPQAHDASKQASAHSAGEKSSTTPIKQAGENRFSVGCDVAMEAVGVGALTQGVSMVSKLCTEGWNPAKAGAGQRTMEDLTGGEIGGDLFGGTKSKTSRCIGGGTPAGLSERSECFNLFAQNPGKMGKANGMGKTTAELHKEVQHKVSAKLASEKKLGQAMKAEQEVGAKVAKMAPAIGQGNAMQLVKNMEKGPKAPDFEKEAVVEETTSSWV
ncbi:MAG: hypothetical protein MRY79_00835 [Alphaproteobacteria bacterium]|nr:hypothetical protein [Alphaproteobacteria bacterium]